MKNNERPATISPKNPDKAGEPFMNCRLCFNDVINAMFGEAESLRWLLVTVNWRRVAAGIGFLAAVAHLILIHNPDINYLYAVSHVRGFQVTLPEAVAAVNAMGWFGLILRPMFLVLVQAVVAWLMFRVSKLLKGAGSFHDHLGIATIALTVVLLGQITGYVLIGSKGFQGVNDLRDLTPGVGLGLLPWFTLERIGLFWHEIVRGCDLFGLWLVFLGTGMFQAVNGFSRPKSLVLTSGYFAAYGLGRWFVEGPGYRLWHYFWTLGSN